MGSLVWYVQARRVRARLRSHLEALKQRFLDLLNPYEIQQFSGADYTFRIFVPKMVWAEVVTQMIHDIPRFPVIKVGKEPLMKVRYTGYGL